MRTIAAQEIKRRGISAVDPLLAEGPVHVFTHNRPRYVILDEARYRALLAAEGEAHRARLQAALAEAVAGDTREFSSSTDLLAAIDEIMNESDWR